MRWQTYGYDVFLNVSYYYYFNVKRVECILCFRKNIKLIIWDYIYASNFPKIAARFIPQKKSLLWKLKLDMERIFCLISAYVDGSSVNRKISIIPHYNPLARITTQLFTSLLLCMLFAYMGVRSCSLNSKVLPEIC